MDKLIICKEPKHAPYGGIRIGHEAYIKLKELSKKTGLSMNRLATICLDFALERIEIEGEN